MEKRIEEFTRDGKNFISFDLSEFKANDEYREFIKVANTYTPKHAEKSLYTITNIRDVSFDSETKTIMAEWMKQNEPYVKHGALIGVDGIRRIIINAVIKMSGRKNITFALNKEQAIEGLLKIAQDLP